MDGSRGYIRKISVRMIVIRLAAVYILYQGLRKEIICISVGEREGELLDPVSQIGDGSDKRGRPGEEAVDGSW